jgi:hypothetical protein
MLPSDGSLNSMMPLPPFSKSLKTERLVASNDREHNLVVDVAAPAAVRMFLSDPLATHHLSNNQGTVC